MTSTSRGVCLSHAVQKNTVHMDMLQFNTSTCTGSSRRRDSKGSTYIYIYIGIFCFSSTYSHSFFILSLFCGATLLWWDHPTPSFDAPSRGSILPPPFVVTLCFKSSFDTMLFSFVSLVLILSCVYIVAFQCVAHHHAVRKRS